MTRMKFREVVRLPEFDRDMKKLVLRYKTLAEDLARFVNIQLFLYHKAGKENRGIARIDSLGATTKPVFKAKKSTSKNSRRYFSTCLRRWVPSPTSVKR